MTHRLPMLLTVLFATPLVALLPVAHASGPRPTPRYGLRHITHHLIAELANAEAVPPFPENDRRDLCLEHSIESPFKNPYSPLPKHLARRHQRITLSGKPAARVEMRDAFLLDIPRAMTFELTPATEPRLEFAYHVLHCGDVPRKLTLRIRGEDALGVFEQTLQLPVARLKPDGDRFRAVSIELPFAPDFPARLTVTFESDTPRAQVAWVEPVITGRDAGPAGLRDTNVLWIVIDALRTDALGPSRSFSVGDAVFTPNLDAVIAQGTSFTDAYTMANQTRTSTTAMLASVHPSIGGFHSHSWAFAEGRLDKFYAAKPPLVTRLLDEAGWRVVHLGNNFFLWGNLIYGIDHGFPRAIDHRAVPGDAPATTAEATGWLDRHQDERWFMMLNYTAPHTPYKPPEDLLEKALALPGGKMLGQFLPRTYLGELMWVDQNLGPVFAKLDELGLSDDTVIIVTADHGEVMNPAHACYSAIVGQPCAYNHSLTVYDDELRVPLSLTLPGRIANGHVVRTPVSHADLAPTVLDLLGLPPDRAMEGTTLRPALEGAEPAARPIYADGRLASAFRSGDWKLIQHAAQDDVMPRTRMTKESDDPPRQELFDLRLDPHEMHNLVFQEPARAKALTAELTALRRRYVAAFRREAPTALAAGLAVPPAPDDDTYADNHLRLEHDGRAHRAHITVRVPDGVKAVVSCLGGGCAMGPGGELALTLDTQGGMAVTGVTDGSAPGAAAGGDRAAAGFRVSPWGAPLEVRVTVDDAPVPLDHVRLGRWGVALLGPGERFDGPAQWALAVSGSAPLPQPHETALYLWRSAFAPGRTTGARPSAGGTPPLGTASDAGVDDGVHAPEDDAAQDLENDEHLSGEVRKVLKDLGYTH